MIEALSSAKFKIVPSCSPTTRPPSPERASISLTAIGASCPLPWRSAKVPSRNRQRALSLGGGNRYSCPKCVIRDDTVELPSRANKRHGRATSAASLPCRLSPSTIRVGGVLLAREQRRLAAIVTADMVGYSHAAYEQIYYSSLMPRTYLCSRLLETLEQLPDRFVHK